MAAIVNQPIGAESTVVLGAYIDASGEDRGHPVAAVCGFVSKVETWVLFEARWKGLIATYEVQDRRIKAAEFWSKSGQYASWPDTMHAALAGEIMSVFRDFRFLGICKALNLKAFDEWRNSIGHFVEPDPYLFGLGMCMRAFIGGISEVGNDEGVAVYIDNDEQRHKLGDAMAAWSAERNRRAPRPHMNRERTVSFTYGSSRDYVPLQAADFLANGVFKYARDHGKKDRQINFIDSLQGIDAGLFVDYLSTPKHFAIEWQNGRPGLSI